MHRSSRTPGTSGAVRTRRRVPVLRGVGVLGACALVAVGLAMPTANAAVVTTVSTSYAPLAQSVGGLVTVAAAFANNNDDVNIAEDSNLTSIVVTPSCGVTDASGCTAAGADPGVISLTDAEGALGTSCDGDTFTVGTPDAVTGAVTLTPLLPATAPVIPPTGTCRIDMTGTVLKVPTKDAVPAAGVQTKVVATALAATTLVPAGVAAVGTAGTLTVTQAAPTIRSFPVPNDGTTGGSFKDSALIEGRQSPTASDKVQFFLHGPFTPGATVGPGDCVANNVFTSAPAQDVPDGNPASTLVISPAASPAPTQVGDYYWIAQYSGDANNAAASGACGDPEEKVTITAGDGDGEGDGGGATCQGKAVTMPGGSGNDIITGTDEPDVIAGGSGNDQIDGGGGDDTICGGSGNDIMDGGDGTDSFDGGSGNDISQQ